ncbi:endogenous retrovirus group 3 member 1 Env polyprotein-like [Strix aluco]|uniref:endogenous retrovirus group 3 member 1 Env polyprotein-like n=1 Tax=Strix aluco TaxID=111821 RepID=UPI003DA4B325
MMCMLILVALCWGLTYEAEGKPIPPPLPNPHDPLEDNEFVLLAKTVNQTFNLSHCWVCGGPLGLSSWPWVSIPLSPSQIVSNYSDIANTTWDDSGTWPVQFPNKGKFCLNRTQKGGVDVGESRCQWTLTHKLINKDRGIYVWLWLNEQGRSKGFKGFWSNKNETEHAKLQGNNFFNQTCKWKNDTGSWYCTIRINNHLNEVFSPLGDRNTTYFQSPRTAEGPFAKGTKAKKGHYWVCGHTAYKQLPANWSGICYVGIIRPLFFLLPEADGPQLGIRLYDKLGNKRTDRNKRSVEFKIGGTQKWGENEWPPERIIEHYGPATWNPNEPISGAREPIYNLNRIIRLQAILEIITNKTANAIDLLTQQSQQMRTAILQHRMVLDYLLAEEGGVCGKLNVSNCCLKIADVGEVVLQLTIDIRKLAHVPVQTWNGWSGDLWSWLLGAPWVKQLLFYLICAFAVLMFLPCIIPCFIQLIQRVVSNMQFISTVAPDGVKQIRIVHQPKPVAVSII